VAAAQHAPVADVDAWMRAQPNWQSLLSADGVHPTQAGYREIVLKVLMPTLEPLVEKARRAKDTTH
jgi:lysophospholipase L1-like esterase